MKTSVLGCALLAISAILVATGVLPPQDAAAVAQRVWPILLFAVAVTIVAELAAEAGLFAAIAERLARLGVGRAWMLWLLVVLLAVASTVFLSLDTTAVLLTPVVILLARHNGLPPLPFALTTVWLANTGSLLLPVSNLTNLLAEHALGFSDPGRFAALMAAPAARRGARADRDAHSCLPPRAATGTTRPGAADRRPPAASSSRRSLSPRCCPAAGRPGVPVWIPAVAAAPSCSSRLRGPPPAGAAVRPASRGSSCCSRPDCSSSSTRATGSG